MVLCRKHFRFEWPFSYRADFLKVMRSLYERNLQQSCGNRGLVQSQASCSLVTVKSRFFGRMSHTGLHVSCAMQGRKPSEVSLENHARSSQASLDSFADSAFGGPASVKSVPQKGSPTSPRPAGTDDFGFGESAFRFGLCV